MGQFVNLAQKINEKSIITFQAPFLIFPWSYVLEKVMSRSLLSGCGLHNT